MENSILGYTRAELWDGKEFPQWMQDAEVIYGPFIRASGMQLTDDRTICLTRFERGWRLTLDNATHPTNPCDIDLWITPEGMESIMLLATILRDQPIDPEHPYPALETMLDKLEQKNQQA